ncbi:Metallo-hydrolase/oxidoreductase [Lepidopterella palustris CBS 459.81]|uniref:Metallo-hydrolase/oxidoreductase n=1 Tax=Lepidopterella palustris CBS 459.81 TaxID=1314670 RepID=A0A8E2EJ65_9PEZI|nr:Metallo-hydrolase/oxidoreductase [Lepidopterella palustris CBS 459.81]
MAASLIPLPEVERLSSRVIRILGGNPGKFTLQGTNTYLVGQGPNRLLIDTGEGKPAWIQSLKSTLASVNVTIDRAILTHWHPDHVGGVKDLLELSSDIRVYKNEPTEGILNIADGQTFKTAGATLRAFHCPGHTTDHMALILEEEDAMFTGDNILGQGTAVFEDLATYMQSLDRMSGQFSGRAYPGHGPVIEDGKGKVLEYIQHRRQREEQVLAVLSSEDEEHKQGWKSMVIVKIIYKDYPENLHAPAERGVLQILEKLAKEGKVVRHENGELWAINRKATL